MDGPALGTRSSAPTARISRQARERRQRLRIPSGFHTAYRDHFAFAWRTVIRLGVTADEAEDAVQEVFMVALRRWAEFEGRASVRTWLFAIARRVASHHRRRGERRSRRHRAFSGTSPQTVDGEQVAHEQHAALRLQAFLDRLDPPKRDVFVLADLEGFTGREVAATLGINANTAWSRLKAARAEFAATFGAPIRKQSALLRESDAPPGARAQVWALLVPQLSTAGKAGAAMSVLHGWVLGANLKVFATTVALGLGAVGTAAVVVPPPPTATPQPEGEATAEVARVPPAPSETSEPRPTRTRSAAAATVTPLPTVQRPSDWGHHAGSPSVQAPVPVPPAEEEEPPDPGPGGDRELVLVHRARSALDAGRPGFALLLLAQVDREIPNGKRGELGELRRITRVEALCAIGRKATALGEAYRLVRAHDRDPTLVARLQKACGLSPRRPTTPTVQPFAVPGEGTPGAGDPSAPPEAAPAEAAPGTEATGEPRPPILPPVTQSPSPVALASSGS